MNNMNNIPLNFDTLLMPDSIEETSSIAANHVVKVGVFTKYRNRNRSYITDEIAQKFIDKANNGIIPLVGFYDNENKNWASHTGPTLAKGYGYVKGFDGWKTFKDSDDIEREYAVFSVAIFDQYFEEVSNIIGSAQSMELDPDHIDGTWQDFDGEDYFVYTEADLYALCIIGNHEPCFSASAFFNLNAQNYEELSNILFEIKSLLQGGESKMDLENVTTNVVDVNAELINLSTDAINGEETDANIVFTNDNSNFTIPVTDAVIGMTSVEQLPNEYEEKYNELKNQFDELQEKFNIATQQLTEANEKIEQQNSVISEYEALKEKQELERKEALIKTYENVLDGEEIEEISKDVNTFSYNDIESKLAIMYSKKNLNRASDLVPEINNEDYELTAFMSKYKKH